MAKKPVTWVQRWKLVISSEPVLPGVWKIQSGGYVVRGTALDPKSGKLKEVRRVLSEMTDPRAALAWLEGERATIRRGGTTEETSVPRFATFAASLFRAKVDNGDIKSAKGVEKWSDILEHHLLKAPWADHYLDKIRHAHLVDWRDALPKRTKVRVIKKTAKDGTVTERRIEGGTYSPNTMNDWLAVARVIFDAATAKFELVRDPMRGVPDFDTAAHRTYTHEEPNSLVPGQEFDRFLAKLRELYPQHFAFVYLGFHLGQRPSMLRPLRRKGETPDLIEEGGRLVLLVRQSQTVRDEVMNCTKTKRDLRLALPADVAKVIRWHVETQLATPEQEESDLLFPSETGGFRSRSCLDKPFAAVADALDIKKRITPRAMRRTFQDLTRAAKVEGAVAKAISGHATDAMRVHYSTASDDEVAAGIQNVIDLGKRRRKPAKRRARSENAAE